ncbi:hypothetical protein [Solitalea lacus]|uniref:hypothetical protein n=1 Tax=Solitalea lacus TaxID=2911172 RepID=UPI001EDC0D9E|nr:hypothetical protein [Solitalea lacus]UKJ07790.1 hypothetical protein L2B55_01170 [Solitalea lacus]
MKRRFIKINKDQYMADIFKKGLPSNRIIYKTLTAIGATTSELESERHSIIIEPNLPVIKCKETNEILGVSEGIYKDDIIDYLTNDVVHKKIIVTPESFSKVKDACEDLGINMYKTFFLMFDECDRAVKDVNFRKNIVLPMDDFFKFKRKVFISATPLMPSDPRFIKQRFSELVVRPTFDYRIPILLNPTNNILLSLKHYLKQTKSNRYFIFINSTEVIASIIEALQIREDSYVFCAEDSRIKLKASGFNDSWHHFEKKKMNKYNFLTSRFFSAVDLKIDEQPDVLIVTDLTKAKHSIIDPYTDTIQIEGRLRNKIKSLTHITNIDPNLDHKAKEQVLSFLSGCREAYMQIKALRDGATTEGSRATLDQALKKIYYAEFLKYDGSENHYRVDNEVQDKRINGYYLSNENLIKAYEDTEHFKITVKEDEFPLNDVQANQLKKVLSYKQLIIYVTGILEDLNSEANKYNIYSHQIVMDLNRKFPAIVEVYNLLGYQKLKELEFKPRWIFDEVEKIKRAKEKEHFGFISLLKLRFKVGESFTTNSILKVLNYGIRKFGLKLKASLKLMEDYFELSARTTIATTLDGKQVKGFVIKSVKI